MLLYMFGSIMCLFIVFLSHMECQGSRISLCHHANDLSTQLDLFDSAAVSKSIW